MLGGCWETAPKAKSYPAATSGLGVLSPPLGRGASSALGLQFPFQSQVGSADPKGTGDRSAGSRGTKGEPSLKGPRLSDLVLYSVILLRLFYGHFFPEGAPRCEKDKSETEKAFQR